MRLQQQAALRRLATLQRDEKPEIVVINLGHHNDPAMVQRLLDGIENVVQAVSDAARKEQLRQAFRPRANIRGLLPEPPALYHCIQKRR